MEKMLLFLLPSIIIYIIMHVVISKSIGSTKNIMRKRMNLVVDAINGEKDANTLWNELTDTPEKQQFREFKEKAVVCTGYLQPVYDNKVIARYRAWDGLEREIETFIHPDVAMGHEGLEINVYVDPVDANIAITDKEEILVALHR